MYDQQSRRRKVIIVHEDDWDTVQSEHSEEIERAYVVLRISSTSGRVVVEKDRDGALSGYKACTVGIIAGDIDKLQVDAEIVEAAVQV